MSRFFRFLERCKKRMKKVLMVIGGCPDTKTRAKGSKVKKSAGSKDMMKRSNSANNQGTSLRRKKKSSKARNASQSPINRVNSGAACDLSGNDTLMSPRMVSPEDHKSPIHFEDQENSYPDCLDQSHDELPHHDLIKEAGDLKFQFRVLLDRLKL